MTQRIELDFKFISLYLLNVNYNAHLQMERFVNRHLQCFLRGLNVTSFTKELISWFHWGGGCFNFVSTVRSSTYPLFVKIAVYPFVCVSVCCPLKFITSDIDHRNTDFLKILILDLPVNSQNFGLIS